MDALQAFKADPSSPQAQEDLFLEYRGFLYHTAQKFAGYDNAIDIDDLVQEGFAALLKAATTYEPTKGNFLKWLQWAVQRAYLQALGAHTAECEDGVRRLRIPPRAVSLQTPLSDDGESVLEDTIVDEGAVLPEDQAVSACVRETLRGCVNQLPEQQKQITERHYYRRQDMKKAADDLGITYAAAYAAHGKALVNLRKMHPVRRVHDELDYYGGASLASFRRTHTSLTEMLALRELGEIPVKPLETAQ